MSDSRDSGQGPQEPRQPGQGQPYQGPPGPAQGGPSYQQPPKRRSKLVPWLIAAGVVLVLCCGGGIAAIALVSDDDDDTAAGPSTQDDGQPEGAAGVGEPVRDGDFEFVVTEIETGVQSVGDQGFGEQAQGEFVLVHLSVENIGTEPQSFDGEAQKLFDAEGREHSHDTEAAIYVDESESLLNEINPGNEIDGVLIFDLPPDAEPETLELHDSLLSDGVAVSVR